MIPPWILFGVATGGGDFEPEHPLYASGVILPLWAQILTRTRGEGWGEGGLCFADLVMKFMAGVPMASFSLKIQEDLGKKRKNFLKKTRNKTR